MEYRGYIGSVEFSEEDDCFHGKVLGIRGLISYEGESVQELKKDFHEAIDEHIDFLERTAMEGVKDGRTIRMASLSWQNAARLAEARGLTLDSFIEESVWSHAPQQRAS